MTRATPISETVTLHVPYRVVKRGGRKEIQLPDGVQPDRKADSTLVKALARAFRWKRMLEAGEFATIAELAEREGIAAPYLTRMMRLSHLSPELVESILDGHQPRHLTLEVLRQPLPEDWTEQKRSLGAPATPQDLQQIRGFTSEPRHVTVKEKRQA
ncbi:hypothetical protein [Oceanibaculum sp.]|uniref:hypothetical protein n=1 Tax=Oceanibaculum sp. TaxID=1903597 RepID=UPI00258CBE89|nr:hypothetical protein [Oceanibaculum sp.]MCH2394206.1 hypothetical protein [Oceanibaculum sp.]